MAEGCFGLYLESDYRAGVVVDNHMRRFWATDAIRRWTFALEWWTRADAARREAANG
jgi:hypothetical protein